MTPMNSSVEGGLENGSVLSFFFLFWEVGVIERRKRLIPSTLNMEKIFLIYNRNSKPMRLRTCPKFFFLLCVKCEKSYTDTAGLISIWYEFLTTDYLAILR